MSLIDLKLFEASKNIFHENFDNTRGAKNLLNNLRAK